MSRKVINVVTGGSSKTTQEVLFINMGLKPNSEELYPLGELTQEQMEEILGMSIPELISNSYKYYAIGVKSNEGESAFAYMTGNCIFNSIIADGKIMIEASTETIGGVAFSFAIELNSITEEYISGVFTFEQL